MKPADEYVCLASSRRFRPSSPDRLVTAQRGQDTALPLAPAVFGRCQPADPASGLAQAAAYQRGQKAVSRSSHCSR